MLVPVLTNEVSSKQFVFFCCLLCSLPPGPFGERDDQQVFIQKLVPDTDYVIVRFSSTGKR